MAGPLPHCAARRPARDDGHRRMMKMRDTSKLEYTYCDSPVGPILLAGQAGQLHCISFRSGCQSFEPAANWDRNDVSFKKAVNQIAAYFAGELVEFDLPLELAGTPFQREVWSLLLEIPFGETTTYGALAARMGRPRSSRAVGGANGANPLPIIVPCHRVVGSDRSLTGFGGGVETKRFLLEHERRCADASRETRKQE